MTLYEFRKRTESISNSKAKKMEMRLMLRNNIFMTPLVSNIQGTDEIFIQSEKLDDYLEEVDFT